MWLSEKEGNFKMREKILTYIEKNSRIDVAELALRVGADEQTVRNPPS